MAPLRFAILGAAAIAPNALVKPAAADPTVEVLAVAARSRERAQAFADRHGIPRVHDTYDDVLADPEVDAVYNPLPNGLHGRWTVAALRAGKHVLCEKPFTANADEARAVAEVARASDRVVMEAFHWRYHPLAARVLEIVRSGEIGELRHVAASFCFPLPRKGDIRWSIPLAGGALMDAGCYPVHMVRTVAGTEPEVISATSSEGWGGVDRATSARLRFPALDAGGGEAGAGADAGADGDGSGVAGSGGAGVRDGGAGVAGSGGAGVRDGGAGGGVGSGGAGVRDSGAGAGAGAGSGGAGVRDSGAGAGGAGVRDRGAGGAGSGGAGPTGAVTCSMWSHRLAAIWLRAEGSEGTLKVRNPLMPHLFGRIAVTAGGATRRERPWPGTTYSYQLSAFTAAVRDGAPFPTGVDDAVANMAVIDAIYRAAGVEPRQPTP